MPPHGLGFVDGWALHATVADPNTASLVVMKRLGFEHVRDIAEDDGTTTRVLTLKRPSE